MINSCKKIECINIEFSSIDVNEEEVCVSCQFFNAFPDYFIYYHYYYLSFPGIGSGLIIPMARPSSYEENADIIYSYIRDYFYNLSKDDCLKIAKAIKDNYNEGD